MPDIDLQPTERMAANAVRGLELRKKHGRGGTEIGVARARDISNRKNLSPDTVRRMNSYFARHAVDKQGEGWGEDSAGYIAWLLWGGDAGRAWAKRKSEELDNKQDNAMSEMRKQIAERLGFAASSRPGAKAKMAFRTWQDEMAWLENEIGEVQESLEAMEGKQYDKQTDYLQSLQKELKVLRQKHNASRPGVKGKFEQAAWMPNIKQFLRNLTAEKQKIRVWIVGPNTVKVAGAWQSHRGPFGLGAAIANRTAYWLQQAAKQAGSTASMEGEDRKDEPRKGVNTTIWTVKDIPADAVAYLKAWGIGTTPGSFAGFTGQSAVAYARPGAKVEFATDGFAVTDAEYEVLAANEANQKRLIGLGSMADYIITAEDRALQKRAEAAFAAAKTRHDAWDKMWKQASTSAEKAEVERRAAESERGMKKWKYRGRYGTFSRPGAKTRNAADILKVEVMDGSTVTSSMTPSDFMAYAKRSLPGIGSISTLPDMIARFNELAEEKSMRVRVRSNLAKSNNAVREGEKLSASESDPAVSRKISKLMAEGKPQDQAIAIALDMKRRGEI